jgi:hypothetical protein
MNVPGFIGDIFNGIDFQEFLDSLPQFPVANFRQNAPFGGILQAGESGSPGGFLYNIFYQNWVEETLFVDLSTCPAVENEPECVVNSQGDTGQWTCRTLFHPVSGTPNPFPSVATSNIRYRPVWMLRELARPLVPSLQSSRTRGPAFS